MTILATIQAAAAALGIEVPEQVYGSTERDAVELGAVANEVAARIAGAAPWHKFKRLTSNTGDGTLTTFSLPSDFDRFPYQQAMWSSTRLRPVAQINDHNLWLGMTLNSTSASTNAWTLIGEYLTFLAAPDEDEIIYFYYMSNLYAQDAGAVNRASFTADDDIFRLNERMLKLAIIWQWKANKGLPYAEDLANFEQEFGRQALRDSGPRGFAIGKGRLRAPVGYPYILGDGTATDGGGSGGSGGGGGGGGSLGDTFWSGLAATWGGADVTW